MKNLSLRIGTIILGLVLIFGVSLIWNMVTSNTTETSYPTPVKTVGKLLLKNATYEGEIIDSKANGLGTLTYANGNVYEDKFKDNKREGHGTLTTLYNGAKGIYVGQFANDQKTGEGYLTLTYPDGRVYQGDYKSFPEKSYYFPPDTIPNDGYYHPSSDNPPGFFVKSITFHEGFRAPGLKAVDVEVVARSMNGENKLVRDRDEIVEIVGTSGKVYNMEGSKGTGITQNLQDGTYTEESIVQYTDVGVTEENITSVVLRRDGKRIRIKVEGIIPVVTHK